MPEKIILVEEHKNLPGKFQVNVAGVTHNNEDGTSRQVIIRLCKKGEPLFLKHEPVEQDEYAVKVLRENGNQIGYLSRELAARIAPILDSGKNIKAEIVNKDKWASNDGKTKLGCRIELTMPGHGRGLKITRMIALGFVGLIIILFIVGLASTC